MECKSWLSVSRCEKQCKLWTKRSVLTLFQRTRAKQTTSFTRVAVIFILTSYLKLTLVNLYVLQQQAKKQVTLKSRTKCDCQERNEEGEEGKNEALRGERWRKRWRPGVHRFKQQYIRGICVGYSAGREVKWFKYWNTTVGSTWQHVCVRSWVCWWWNSGVAWGDWDTSWCLMARHGV